MMLMFSRWESDHEEIVTHNTPGDDQVKGRWAVPWVGG